MKQFKISPNCSLEFDDNWQAYNYFRKYFKDMLDGIDEGVHQVLGEVSSTNTTLENFVDRVQSFANNQLDTLSDFIVRILFAANIKNYSKEKFFNEYYFKYINFDAYLEPIFKAIAEVNHTEAALEEIRRQKLEMKNQWVGGGFGFTGAIKGSLQASVMNYCTTSWRKLVSNPLDRIADESNIRKMKQEILNSREFKKLIFDAFHNSTKGYFMALIEILLRNNIISNLPFYDIFIQDDEDIRNEFENTLNYADTSNVEMLEELCIKAIKMSPYNIIYYFTYKLLEPYNADIDEMLKELNIYEELKKHTLQVHSEEISALPERYQIERVDDLIDCFDSILALSSEGVPIDEIISPYINLIPDIIVDQDDSIRLKEYVNLRFMEYHKKIKDRIFNKLDVLESGGYAITEKDVALFSGYYFKKNFKNTVKLARNNNVLAQYYLIKFVFDHRFLIFAEDLADMFNENFNDDGLVVNDYREIAYDNLMCTFFPDFKNNGFDLLMATLYYQILIYTFEDSETGPENLETVLKMLEESLRLGCNAAAYYIALLYYSQGEYMEGKNYMLIAADAEFEYAKKFVGKGYRKGQYGFEQNIAEGERYDALGWSDTYTVSVTDLYDIVIELCVDKLIEEKVSPKEFSKAYFDLLSSISASYKWDEGNDISVTNLESSFNSYGIYKSLRLEAGEEPLGLITEENLGCFMVFTNKNICVKCAGIFQNSWDKIALRDFDYSSVEYRSGVLKLISKDGRKKLSLNTAKAGHGMGFVEQILERIYDDLYVHIL